jgi:protein-S-isoprenylcysteine O-methyltransferase
MSQTTTLNGSTISSPQPATKPPQYRQTTSPPATNLLPHSPHYVTRNSIPNTPLAVSAISAALGALAAGCLVAAAQPVFRLLGSGHWGWARPQLGLYGLAMGMFHLWEFWTTAGWNPQKLSVDGEPGFCG